jgi:serine/threonine protein phosphatase 1
VGDIHGRADLLEAMLHRIAGHILAQDADDAQVVFLGDYIDRGAESAAVLRRLADLALAEPQHVRCLRGNHEQMLLDFLDDPAAGPVWLWNGGRETLTSFGLASLPHDAPAAALVRLRAEVREVLSDGLEDWLRSLPLSLRLGTLWAVHAGADPSQPMDRQVPHVLIWGHPEFATRPRRDGLWVVHGHTITEEAKAEGGRISVDTGAVFTGRLTAAAILPEGRVEFLTVEG